MALLFLPLWVELRGHLRTFMVHISSLKYELSNCIESKRLSHCRKGGTGDNESTKKVLIQKHTQSKYIIWNYWVFYFFNLLSESNHLKKFNVTVTPNQIAKDFKRLRQQLSESFPGYESILVGPDVTQPRGNALKYLRK